VSYFPGRGLANEGSWWGEKGVGVAGHVGNGGEGVQISRIEGVALVVAVMVVVVVVVVIEVVEGPYGILKYLHRGVSTRSSHGEHSRRGV
jgi:hypothetical protein